MRVSASAEDVVRCPDGGAAVLVAAVQEPAASTPALQVQRLGVLGIQAPAGRDLAQVLQHGQSLAQRGRGVDVECHGVDARRVEDALEVLAGAVAADGLLLDLVDHRTGELRGQPAHDGLFVGPDAQRQVLGQRRDDAAPVHDRLHGEHARSASAPGPRRVRRCSSCRLLEDTSMAVWAWSASGRRRRSTAS